MSSFLFFLSLFSSAYSLNEPLKIPELLNLNPGFLDLTIRGRNVTIYDWEEGLEIKFLTRVYCWNSTEYGEDYCDIPGPTWIMQAGTTSTVRLTNDLVGFGSAGLSVTNQHKPSFMEYDVSNLHTHGLHDDPNVDDIWNVWVNPTCPQGFNPSTGSNCSTDQVHTYPYEIKNIHYPGTHWYHAHWPGSVAYQVGGGLYGLIRMKPKQEYVSQEPTFTAEYDLLSSWGWFIDSGSCTPGNGKLNRGKPPLNFPIASFCRLWHRDTSPNDVLYSGTPYKQEIRSIFNDTIPPIQVKRFMVNGQINPYVNISTNHWYRLRIVSVTMNYLIFDIRHLRDECQFYIIANDGVYFNHGSRDLFNDIYNGTTVVVPGSRADIAVNCYTTGEKVIIASNYTRGLSGIKFGPVPDNIGNFLTLNVMDNTTIYAGNYTPSFSFLSYSVSPYLTNTTDVDTTLKDFTGDCTTDDYTEAQYINKSLSFQQPLTQCNLALSRQCLPAGFGTIGGKTCGMSVDQIRFDAKKWLMKINSNKTHEWSITSNYHPFHHHTWPFQIQRDVTGGWIAQKGDWRDTVGAAQSYIARVNYVDYLEGTLIVHCHFVPHEDNGMMAKVLLTSPVNDLNLSHIIPRNTQNITTKSSVPGQQLPIKDCPIGRHAITCINIKDINTKLVIILNVKYNETTNECVLHINTGAELRFGTPQNFWYSFGFGGQYADYSSFEEGFKFAFMDGLALTFQYDLYEFNMDPNTGAVKVNTLQSFLQNQTYHPQINDTTYIQCQDTHHNFTDGRLYVASFCTRVIHRFDLALRRLINDPNNQTIIWAYGEGAYSEYSMHSARNPCGIIWNDNNFSANTQALRCIQTEGNLGHGIDTVSGHDECASVINRFEFYTAINDDNVVTGINEELKQPQLIDLSPGSLTLTVKKKNTTIIDYDLGVEVIFQTRMYCWNDTNDDEICDIPGPTWIMQAGQTSNVTLINGLVGFGTAGPPANPHFGDFDVTNLHTHGLHDDPNVDNIWSVWTNPTCPQGFNPNTGRNCSTDQSHFYSYEILDIHYPGSHWYHAHWPGSVAYQVGGGLYGLIRMEPFTDYVEKEPLFSGDFDILASWAWFVDNSQCQPGFNEKIFRGKYPLNFPVMSLCKLWLDADSNVGDLIGTQNSGTPYNQVIRNIDGSPGAPLSLKRFVVNGQINPYISIETYHWYRLRIVSITMNYLLFDISSAQDYCEFYLIANDGVYFKDGSRNIADPPYNGTTIVVPGSRADITVKCNTVGVYQIWATNDTRGLDGIKFGPTPDNIGRLLTLVVVDNSTAYDSNIYYTPDFSFLSYAVSPYLNNTLDWNNTLRPLTSECDTIDYKRSMSIPNPRLGYQSPLTQCNLALTRKCYPPGNGTEGAGLCGMSVDQVRFDAKKWLMRVNTNKTHEWSVLSNYHPFHHHTWPFQVQRQVTNGWIAERGDWRDTVGASSSYIIRANYIDYYDSTLIVHCHFVPHEDKGMMAKVRLLPPGTPLKPGNMIPRNTENITLRASGPDKLPKEECPSGKHAISCINIRDINTKLIIIINIKWDDTAQECVIHLNSGSELRHGLSNSNNPGNYWYAWAFGGRYTHDGLFNKFNNIVMEGTALVHQINLYNNTVDTLQATLIAGRYNVSINQSTTYLNCEPPKSNYTNGRLYVATLCTRVVHRFDLELIKLINTTQNETFLWAYGEGAFTRYAMHSARNPCGIIWNVNGERFNDSIALKCIQYQGSLGTNINTIASHDECRKIIDLFDIIEYGNGVTPLPTVSDNTLTPTVSPSKKGGGSGGISDGEIGGIVIGLCIFVLVALLVWGSYAYGPKKKAENTGKNYANEIELGDTVRANSVDTNNTKNTTGGYEE